MCKINEIFTSELFAEVCCELCGETVHNHFKCPVCKDKYAGTSIYDCIFNHTENSNKFSCQECNSEFEIVKDEDGYIDSYEFNIKLLSNGLLSS
jgi:hypothetical protein